MMFCLGVISSGLTARSAYGFDLWAQIDRLSGRASDQITWNAPAVLAPTPTPKPSKPKVRSDVIGTKSAAADTAWTKGLAAWRAQQFDAALRNFTQCADHPKTNVWTRAGALFWAARAAEAQGDARAAKAFLTRAAELNRTFYGQLATARLGLPRAYDWAVPVGSVDALRAHPDVATLQAHMNAGRLSAADQTLLKMTRGASKDIRAAALVYATTYRLPATAYALAEQVERETGARVDAAMYPLGNWVTPENYTVDPALVHAIIRQESRFDTNARSHMGATGLMQLMPSTATYMIKTHARGLDTIDLNRSIDNISLGQDYVAHLFKHKGVDRDILNLLVAYNAGPGNLIKWQKNLGVNDPLLFIETIPSAETRDYVERVMAAYWMYRDRLGASNPTLSQLAGVSTAPARMPKLKFAPAQVALMSEVK